MLILNGQFCDNDGTLEADWADGDVAGHAGLTVRALRLVVFDREPGADPAPRPS